MNPRTPFQFVVLRYIHDSFTGEFLNVGLALYSKSPSFFQAKFLQKYARLTGAFPRADGEFYKTYISHLQLKADGLADKINSQQASFMPSHPDRIEELLAKILPIDDSSIQFGPTQGGLSNNLEATFEDLYKRLVIAHLPYEEHLSRSEAEVWLIYSKLLRERNVISLLRPTTIHTPKQEIDLDHAWKNGRWNAMQPLSFDLLKPASINNKAFQYFGRNVVLGESKEFGKLYYLLGRPRREEKSLQTAYDKAKDLLGTGLHSKKVQIVEEDGAEDFARFIGAKIEKDTTHDS